MQFNVFMYVLTCSSKSEKNMFLMLFICKLINVSQHLWLTLAEFMTRVHGSWTQATKFYARVHGCWFCFS